MSRSREGRPVPDDRPQFWLILGALGSVGRFVVAVARALADGVIDRLATVIREWFGGGTGA